MKKFLFLLFFISKSVLSNSTIFTGNTSDFDGKIIFVNEYNIYRNTLYNDLSLQHYGPKWTFGVQAVNIRYNSVQAQNFENDTYLNLSRKFDLGNLTLEIGDQIGTNLDGLIKRIHDTGFSDLTWNLSGNIFIHGGLYYVNDTLATKHQPVNFQSGIKVKYNKFSLIADYYSGNNNLSGANLNLFYKLTENIRPYIGVQVPETNSGNEFAGTIGISCKLN